MALLHDGRMMLLDLERGCYHVIVDDVLECVYEPVNQQCFMLRKSSTISHGYFWVYNLPVKTMKITLPFSTIQNSHEHKIIEGLRNQIRTFRKRNEGLASQVSSSYESR
jgi:hypothetical protein